jgi:hypothetical protein
MGNLASDPDKLQDDGVGDMSSKDFYESDGFSDIDDAEVRTSLTICFSLRHITTPMYPIFYSSAYVINMKIKVHGWDLKKNFKRVMV